MAYIGASFQWIRFRFSLVEVCLKDNTPMNVSAVLRTPLLLTALAFFLAACGDRAYVNVYDRNITRTPIPCLRLKVFPPDPDAQRAVESLYRFSDRCPYTLELSTKSGIHCNSNANVPQKATSNFPSAYLRMELRRGMRLLYSYYIDLTHKPDAEDIERGFDRLRNDLILRTPAGS
jgi:hypothetical protein